MISLKKYALLIWGGIVAALGMLALFFRSEAAQAKQEAAERDQAAQKARADQLADAQQAAENSRKDGDELIQEADRDPTDDDWNNRFN